MIEAVDLDDSGEVGLGDFRRMTEADKVEAKSKSKP